MIGVNKSIENARSEVCGFSLLLHVLCVLLFCLKALFKGFPSVQTLGGVNFNGLPCEFLEIKEGMVLKFKFRKPMVYLVNYNVLIGLLW